MRGLWAHLKYLYSGIIQQHVTPTCDCSSPVAKDNRVFQESGIDFWHDGLDRSSELLTCQELLDLRMLRNVKDCSTKAFHIIRVRIAVNILDKVACRHSSKTIDR